MNFKSSQLIFRKKWPSRSELGDEVLFIYDRILEKKSVGFSSWIRNSKLKYAVSAGESLKDVRNFADHIEKITSLTEKTSVRKLTVCVIGGGSVGDFGGFVASVLKRGVRLVHIPSTWLAAIDSAHGGKTALNVSCSKNQIGTFYTAEKVFLIQDLLLDQPTERVFEGFSELFKIALLQGGKFWNKIAQEKKLDASLLWKYLPEAIKAKLKIVSKDPKEKTGYRHILNLGHTIGHVVESQYRLPHGIAINYGLDFALRWSLIKGFLTVKEYHGIQKAPLSFYLLSMSRDHLVPRSIKQVNQFKSLLLTDKKKTEAQTLRFVFLKKPGSALVQEVTVGEVLQEMQRQFIEDGDE